jgi:hypothetical protein
MSEAVFFTSRLSAALAFQKFAKALCHGLPNATIASGNCNTSLRDGHFAIPGGEVKAALTTLAAQPPLELRQFEFVHLKNLTIQLTGVSSNKQAVNVTYGEQERDFGARVTLHSTELWRPDSLTSLVTALHAEFTLRRHDALVLDDGTPQDRQVLRAYENALSDMQANLVKLESNLVQQEARISGAFLEKTNELEQRYLQREKALEEKVAAREQELAGRETRLREREEALEAQDRTTTRRDLLRKIREILEQQRNVRLSPGTIAKRQIITITSIIVMAVGIVAIALPAGLILAYGMELTRAAPMSLGAVLFASTLIFFLRWNDAWFRDHARAEFQAMRNHADILRASWVAELYFEWTETKETEFPPLLAERLTQNLFVEGKDHVIAHPAEQVVSALKNVHLRAANIELDTGKKK